MLLSLSWMLAFSTCDVACENVVTVGREVCPVLVARGPPRILGLQAWMPNSKVEMAGEKFDVEQCTVICA